MQPQSTPTHIVTHCMFPHAFFVVRAIVMQGRTATDVIVTESEELSV